MAIIAYRRVSTTDQALDRQLIGLQFDREFSDVISGTRCDRAGLDALLGHIRAGDTIHVQSIDRVARSLSDLLAIIKRISDTGATVRFHTEALTIEPAGTSPVSDLLLHVMGAVAQFERSLIRERQARGIERAKAEGKYKGRPPCAHADAIRQLLKSGQTPTAVAKALKISRSTVYAHKFRADE